MIFRRHLLSPRQTASVPAFPGWGAALGPGVVWLALAQGSGELIWWPSMVAKYSLEFLILLIPSGLLPRLLVDDLGHHTVAFPRPSRRTPEFPWGTR